MADGSERAPGGDPEMMTAGYERLRAAVLSGGVGGWRLGHGVLSARGMAGWMSVFGELAAPAPAPAGVGAGDGAPAFASEDRASSAGQSVALPATDQVVAVLAQMTLALAA